MLNKIKSFKINNDHTVTIKTDYFKIKFRPRYVCGSSYDTKYFTYDTCKVAPTRLGNKLNLKDFKNSVNDFIINKFWCFRCLDVSDESNRYIRNHIPDDVRHSTTICEVLCVLCYGCTYDTDIQHISTDKILENHKRYKKTKPKDIKYRYKELMNKYISYVVKLYNKMEG